ncbi:hypothetical protein GCM10010339_39990 [Streptomyces alanosinicus]|uniref:Uncharacterized protein n=1 Tax=Streptomyces alanosinicus TaxID=68171 RepID=A0A918YJD2_9ACTN|nr:hypothetical protein GCM10010339_39990 [Streptomyces alanosinicus]
MHLGSQRLDGGRVVLVDMGAFAVVGQIAEHVAQVEDGQPGETQAGDEAAQFVGVRVDAVVGDVDDIAEDMSVGADDDAGAGRVDPLDVRAEPVQEAEGAAIRRRWCGNAAAGAGPGSVVRWWGRSRLRIAALTLVMRWSGGSSGERAYGSPKSVRTGRQGWLPGHRRRS